MGICFGSCNLKKGEKENANDYTNLHPYLAISLGCARSGSFICWISVLGTVGARTRTHARTRARAHAHAYTHTHAESLLLPELVLCDHSHLFSPSFLDGVCSPCPFCCSFPEFSAFNVMFICMAFIIFNCGGYFFLGGTHGSVLFYLGFFFF